MCNFLGCFLALFIGASGGFIQSTAGTSPDDLVKQAQSGDANAQFELGRAYEEGKGFPQDYDLAAVWFRKSAEQEYAKAQTSLGALYSVGRGVPMDKEEAVRWYKKAARQGLPEAMYNMAIAYFNGEGIGEDHVLAYAWMELARRNGDAQANEAIGHMSEELHGRIDGARFELARLYEKGDEIRPDPAAAILLYSEVAKLDPLQFRFVGTAQQALCKMYAEGRGVAQDYATARSWCKKEAKSDGYPEACLFLGTTAELGQGTEVNLKEAADWYRLAAFRGAPEGAMQLGRLRLASGSHKDERNAYFWFSLAAYRKAPGSLAAQQQAAAKLTDKEILEQQKQFSQWTKMPPDAQMAQMKKH